MVAELGGVLEKVLIDGKLFQRIGAVRLYERLHVFKRGGGGWAELSAMIGRTSGAGRFNIDKFSEVLGL